MNDEPGRLRAKTRSGRYVKSSHYLKLRLYKSKNLGVYKAYKILAKYKGIKSIMNGWRFLSFIIFIVGVTGLATNIPMISREVINFYLESSGNNLSSNGLYYVENIIDENLTGYIENISKLFDESPFVAGIITAIFFVPFLILMWICLKISNMAREGEERISNIKKEQTEHALYHCAWCSAQLNSQFYSPHFSKNRYCSRRCYHEAGN